MSDSRARRIAGLVCGSGAMMGRLLQLTVGSALIGVAIALLVRANLGLMPWDVWHAGLTMLRWPSMTFGGAIIASNAVVLLAWLPLRVRPGVGTLIGVLVPGVVCDVALAWLPDVHALLARCLFLVVGAGLFGVATGLYLGANLGPGPRDGIMLGLAERGHSVRGARICLDVGILVAGWLIIGPLTAIATGVVGPGTVLVAITVGPIIGVVLPKVHRVKPNRTVGRHRRPRTKPTTKDES